MGVTAIKGNFRTKREHASRKDRSRSVVRAVIGADGQSLSRGMDIVGKLLRIAVVFASILSLSAVFVVGAAAAGTGQYSSPQWLPFRTSDQIPAQIGCAYLSCDNGTYHSWWAIDFGMPVGAPVYAAGAGQLFVFSSGNSGCSATSNSVKIKHTADGSSWSYYAHLDTISVQNGAWVDQNTKIGTVGRTGLGPEGSPSNNCGYPHLHYERRKSETQSGAIDPGKLKACHGSTLVNYPDVTGGGTSWQGFSPYKYYAYSDGTSCSSTAPASGPLNDVFSATGNGWMVRYNGTSSWVALANSAATMDTLLIGDFDKDGHVDDVMNATGNGWFVRYNGTSSWVALANSAAVKPNIALGDFD